MDKELKTIGFLLGDTMPESDGLIRTARRKRITHKEKKRVNIPED